MRSLIKKIIVQLIAQYLNPMIIKEPIFIVAQQVDRQPDGLCLLHIFDVAPEQSGEVKCVAKCGTEQTVCHTNIAVFPQIYTPYDDIEDVLTPLGVPTDDEPEFNNDDNMCPAYIICGPQDCTALIGGQVVLEVIYGGQPEPVIKWLKAVSYSDRVK